jgi:hypothetical protein
VWRKYSDLLIAALILVGATMWISYIGHALLPMSDIVRVALWLVCAFIATQITRRVLVDLEPSVTTGAAILATTVVGGIIMERRHEALQIGLLWPILGSVVGAVLGALTSQRPRREVRLGWRIAAAGFGSFGLTLLMVGVVVLTTDNNALLGCVVFAGAALGNCLLALRIEVNGRICALGFALLFVVLVLGSDRNDLGQALIAMAIVAFVAAIGGGIGARIRTSRRPKAELPEAQAL